MIPTIEGQFRAVREALAKMVPIFAAVRRDVDRFLEIAGKGLRFERRRLGLTPSEMARRCRMSTREYRRIEARGLGRKR